jgi:hypothetical protein
VSSLAPATLNVVWIATLAVLVIARGWPAQTLGSIAPGREEQLEIARVLCWAVLLAGALQLVIQIPALRKHELFGPTPRLEGFDARRLAWGVIRTSTPLAIGAAVYQINVMIDGFMAKSMLPAGGATAYHFASRVQQFPVALIATAAIAAVFPSLKALGTRGRNRRCARCTIAHSSRSFLSLPACIGLIALSRPIVVLFQHGHTDEASRARPRRCRCSPRHSADGSGRADEPRVLRSAAQDARAHRPLDARMQHHAQRDLRARVALRRERICARDVAHRLAEPLLLWPGLVSRVGLPPSSADSGGAWRAWASRRRRRASLRTECRRSFTAARLRLRATLALAGGMTAGGLVFGGRAGPRDRGMARLPRPVALAAGRPPPSR